MTDRERDSVEIKVGGKAWSEEDTRRRTQETHLALFCLHSPSPSSRVLLRDAFLANPHILGLTIFGDFC